MYGVRQSRRYIDIETEGGPAPCSTVDAVSSRRVLHPSTRSLRGVKAEAGHGARPRVSCRV